jgi:DNA helicase HerA-like ATPase
MTLPQQLLCIGARITGEPVMLDPEERRRHFYVIGQTGTGKSTLLLNLIRQDLVAGEGLALLDPHGDLAELALAQVPKARTNDLVYINPADAEWPIGFNPLAQVPDDLKPVVADGARQRNAGLKVGRARCIAKTAFQHSIKESVSVLLYRYSELSFHLAGDPE